MVTTVDTAEGSPDFYLGESYDDGSVGHGWSCMVDP